MTKTSATRAKKIQIKLSEQNLFVILIFLAIATIGGVILFLPFSLNANTKISNLSVIPVDRNTKTLVKPEPIIEQPMKFHDTIVSQIPSFCVNVPVLFYHHIEPLSEAKNEGHAQLTVDNGIFESQLEYLKAHGYVTLAAEDLVRSILKHQNPPTKTVVITLDDGYDDMYQYAFPLAKKYNVILNLMVSTGLVGNNDYVTWDQLKEMVASGIIEAYDHTVHHISVGNGSKDKIQQEILVAKKTLEDNLGKPIDIFTYPYGTYNKNAAILLQQDGFIGAFTTTPGTVQCESNLMYLHRTRVGNTSLSAYGLH